MYTAYVMFDSYCRVSELPYISEIGVLSDLFRREVEMFSVAGNGSRSTWEHMA